MLTVNNRPGKPSHYVCQGHIATPNAAFVENVTPADQSIAITSVEGHTASSLVAIRKIKIVSRRALTNAFNAIANKFNRLIIGGTGKWCAGNGLAGKTNQDMHSIILPENPIILNSGEKLAARRFGLKEYLQRVPAISLRAAVISAFLAGVDSAEAQRYRERPPNPNVLRSQTYSVASGTVTVFPTSGTRCLSTIAIRISAPLRSFFANEQRELSGLWPQILSYLQQSCPEVDTVQIVGYGQTLQTYRGQATSLNGWSLQHEQTPLRTALEELARARPTFENLRPLETVLQRHSEIFGGANTLDAEAVRSRIEAIKRDLADEQIAKIEAEAQKLPETVEGLNQIGKLGYRVFETLRQSYPLHVARFDAVIKRREVAIKDGALLEFDKKLREAPKGWKDAAATIRLARSIRESWGSKIPELGPLTNQAMADVDRAVSEGLDAYKLALNEYPKDWGGLTKASEDVRALQADAGIVSGLSGYITAANEWRSLLLANLEEQAHKDIREAGSGLESLETVIEAGEAKVKQFTEIGASERAERLQDTLSQRVHAIAEANVSAFEQEIQQTEISIDSFRALQELERQYAQLEQSMAVFGRYRLIAERRVGELKSNLCGTALTDFGRADLLDRLLVTERGRPPIRDAACTIFINGGKLAADSGLWRRLVGVFTGDVVVTFEDHHGNQSQITLKPSHDPGHQQGFVGVFVRRGNEDKAIDAKQWLELARIMLQGPPSGAADEAGRTECDYLAADPEDVAKRGEGRNWAAETDLTLAERAIEACVAALEHAPEEPRLQYQMGRLLWLMGEQEQSKAFVEAAATKNYPAAQALKAEMILAANGTYDGFVDAYLLLEQSAKSGYQPALKMVKEFNPQGLDIYKELPTPTSTDLLTALPANQCHEFLGVRTCIRFTGANIKSCMQINRSDFMCEWRPIVNCDNSANPLVDAMFKMACSQTEFGYATFRKLAEGRWQKLD